MLMVVMNKPDNFKQANPKHQSVVILQSIEGWILNLEAGTSSPEKVIEKIRKNLAEMKTLSNWLKDDWQE